MLTFGLSISLLLVTLVYAWKKRRYDWHSIGMLFLASVLPIVRAWVNLLRIGPNQVWEDMVIGMVWEAVLMIIGLCVMYGSTTMHYLGRWMMIFSIVSTGILLAGSFFAY